MTKVSIDRLTLVGDSTSGRALNAYLGSQCLTPNYNIRKSPYRRSFSTSDGGLLQVEPLTRGCVPPLRFDFNPNSTDRQTTKEITSLFDNWHVTRIDVAVDYDRDLSHYVWTGPARLTRITRHSGSGALQSIQFGLARRRFVLYDKRRERRLGSGGPWFRVESQRRYPGTDLLPKDLFEGLRAGSEFVPGLSFPERAVVHYLHDYPSEIASVTNSNTRKKYRSLLTQCTQRALRPQAQEAYLKQYNKVYVDLWQWLPPITGMRLTA